MEKTKTITLSKPLESNDGKVRYEEINLREPCLIEVEQLYEVQNASSNSLPGMRRLISLVSAIPETELKKMAITDFKQCRDFLNPFLA
ncbi:phage tail assembly protein [Morganella morganii]|nr:phage tail assembly protein [Morganella morganii]